MYIHKYIHFYTHIYTDTYIYIQNGVGKTTLLKHMASFEIEGFPRHHRVLHVKQEVKSSEQSVLSVVLEADVERTSLLKKEKELLELQQTVGIISILCIVFQTCLVYD
jgi:ATPase subunit of ABC transporter with duplicated ATPase domains